MRVLVAGATGYIGSAVGSALERAGHKVAGLAHTEEAASAIASRGWRVVCGDVREVETLKAGLRGMDAVVQAANTGGEDAAVVDAAATRALLAGAGREVRVIYTSGVWVLGERRERPADETTEPAPIEAVWWRGELEGEVTGAGGVVVRPGIVYGAGGGIPGGMARGELPVVGSGEQRWPLVHVRDLAELYVLALAAAAGSILHGVSGSATAYELALLGHAGRGRRERPRRVTQAEARSSLGAFGDALALHQEVESKRTRALTGWVPAAPSPTVEFLAGTYGAAA